MTDYISREAAIEEAKKSHLYFDIKPILQRVPAADVRPVVLCRNCQYFEDDCGWCGYFDIGMNVNDFCSHGKRGGKWTKPASDFFCATGEKREDNNG